MGFQVLPDEELQTGYLSDGTCCWFVAVKIVLLAGVAIVLFCSASEYIYVIRDHKCRQDIEFVSILELKLLSEAAHIKI